MLKCVQLLSFLPHRMSMISVSVEKKNSLCQAFRLKCVSDIQFSNIAISLRCSFEKDISTIVVYMYLELRTFNYQRC